MSAIAIDYRDCQSKYSWGSIAAASLQRIAQRVKPKNNENFLVSSGFALLDQSLPDKGWPVGLVELKRAANGVAQLSAFAPAVSALSQRGRQAVFISPENSPYYSPCIQHDAKLENLLSLYPKSFNDSLWSLIHSLSSPKTGMVFYWLDEACADQFMACMYRLKRAAKAGGSTLVVVRQQGAVRGLPGAQLQLAVESASSQSACVKIIKARGAAFHSGRQVLLRAH